MKKLFYIISIITLLAISGCKKLDIALKSPSYSAFELWGEHPPYVSEKKDYAVITTPDSFFIYDKSQKKITKAYGIDVDKSFLPGFFSSIVLDYEKDILLISAEKNFTNFTEYHYIYDIKKDEFKKIKGEGKISKITDSEKHVEFDVGIMSSDLNTIYFISDDNEKIYPFKENFSKESFEIK
ncbi:hypothetical protein HMPREF9709_01444 [Helcococcus kunzii ATCC 51366]|uniref:Uncharacterized protein n=1 Tax=Helcococcus kunzii ATCC 51366 TaxID=883114 RepID=H3NQ33_9FIRM|nr:hypothetical protein [Helcococcus kunzii]EHR32713.1 hypothetical protein HMPREF9709_01444 [Helcococcus kunzii ATCC 51366]